MWRSSFRRYEHVLSEGRNFKKFLKKSYAVALDRCCIFTKKILHGIERDVDSAYGVCINYRHY